MSMVKVSEQELRDKLNKCIAGERVLLERNGERFSARLQQVGNEAITVIPETQAQGIGPAHDGDGLAVDFTDVLEVEVKGVVYSRLPD